MDEPIITEGGIILGIICLGDKRPAKHNAQAPKGKHKPQAIILELLHWEAPACTCFWLEA